MTVLTRRRGRAAAVAAAALALLVPTASHAITGGQPTQGYTNVGSFVVEVPGADGGTDLIQLCTGTLVSPHVVLSASHCMDDSDYPSDWGKVWFTLEQRIADDDSWTLRDDLELLDGTPTPHPSSCRSERETRTAAQPRMLIRPAHRFRPADPATVKRCRCRQAAERSAGGRRSLIRRHRWQRRR